MQLWRAFNTRSLSLSVSRTEKVVVQSCFVQVFISSKLWAIEKIKIVRGKIFSLLVRIDNKKKFRLEILFFPTGKI